MHLGIYMYLYKHMYVTNMSENGGHESEKELA